MPVLVFAAVFVVGVLATGSELSTNWCAYVCVVCACVCVFSHVELILPDPLPFHVNPPTGVRARASQVKLMFLIWFCTRFQRVRQQQRFAEEQRRYKKHQQRKRHQAKRKRSATSTASSASASASSSEKAPTAPHFAMGDQMRSTLNKWTLNWTTRCAEIYASGQLLLGGDSERTSLGQVRVDAETPRVRSTLRHPILGMGSSALDA